MIQWYAIYTKPKSEGLVADSLSRAGIEVFNPHLKQRRYLQGHYRDIIRPLFPSYIFARFEHINTSWMIRYTRGVKKIVGGDSPWPVSDDIIDLIKSNEKDGVVTLRSPKLICGDKVVIKDGPLQGLIGIFERETKGDERVVLLLNAVEYQARVIVYNSSLAKAS
ncbi:MAG: hypothetical protein HY755_11895 [Nitrospirae bacterium]|nr:hypothetical protein [Nitrospirota bacterium]